MTKLIPLQHGADPARYGPPSDFWQRHDEGIAQIAAGQTVALEELRATYGTRTRPS